MGSKTTRERQVASQWGTGPRDPEPLPRTTPGPDRSKVAPRSPDQRIGSTAAKAAYRNVSYMPAGASSSRCHRRPRASQPTDREPRLAPFSTMTLRPEMTATNLDPYAEIAEYYDLEHAGHDADIDLILNLAQVVGDPILELGCGTGRLLVPLAEAGHRVTGLDLSASMLKRAAAAVANASLSSLVTLHHGSMTSADEAPGGPFGLVIIALNGLLHLPTATAQRETLLAARRALDPRGQLAIDLINPSPETLRGLDHGVTHEGGWHLPNGVRVDKFAARRVSPSEQHIETDLWYDRLGADGTVRRTATHYPMRFLHRAELELLLELTGFAEWNIYGGYDLEPFEDGSERLFVTAEVTASGGGSFPAPRNSDNEPPTASTASRPTRLAISNPT